MATSRLMADTLIIKDGLSPAGSAEGENRLEEISRAAKHQKAPSPRSASCCHLDAMLEDYNDSNADSWPWDLTAHNNKSTTSREVKEDIMAATARPPAGASPGPGVRVVYRECQRNQAARMGGQAVDGCGEFMPGGKEGSPEALRCAACDCHRNFHRRVVEQNEAPEHNVRCARGATTSGGSPGNNRTDCGQLPHIDGGSSKAEDRPARPDERLSKIGDLAQLARLSMQALKHNTKVMIATSESLALLQQQRGLELEEMMAAFKRAAAAIGSDLRGGMEGARPQFEAAPFAKKRRMDLPRPTTRVTDSERSTADQEERPSPSPQSHAREHGHAADPSEMGVHGTTSTISTTEFYPQSCIPDNILVVQGSGGMCNGWNDAELNLFQGGGDAELGLGSSHQMIDSNGHLIHIQGMLGHRPRDSDAMMAAMLVDDAGMHQPSEQRDDGSPSISHESYQDLSDEARRDTMVKSRIRSRRGRQGKAKRIRTKLTQNQKDRMEAYAEKVGWTVVGQRKEDVEAACADIGIAQKTLRYWLHNTKQKMKQPHASGGDASRGMGPKGGRMGEIEDGDGVEMMMPVFGLSQETFESSHLWRHHFGGYDDSLDDSLDSPQSFAMSQDLMLQDLQRCATRSETHDDKSDCSM